MTIINVAIVGANGHLGPSVLKALQDSSLFNITVLTRTNSKSKYLPSIITKTLPESLTEAELASVLEGQDAVVVTMSGNEVATQLALANACVKAGVKRFIPADFGSVDSSDDVCLKLVPLYQNKTNVREHLQKLAAENPLFSWTSLVCGHFFDLGHIELLGLNLTAGTADIFDDGKAKWSACTLARIGEGVVKVLQKEELTRDKMLYIQSFCVNQLDLVRSVECSSGKKVTMRFLESNEYIKEKKNEMDTGVKDATEHLVSVLGLTRANWTEKEDFANDLLELAPENFDEVVKEIYLSSTKL